MKLTSYGVGFDGYFYEYATAFSYVGKKFLCGDTVLIFAFNEGYADRFVLVEDKKVYEIFTDCSRELMYDFGLEVGEKMTEGVYTDFTLVNKNEVTLENGEVRFLFELLPPQSSWTEKWIEGIGSITDVFFPFMHYESDGVFVCARDSSGMLWSNPSTVDRCDSLSCLFPRPKFSHELNEYEIKFTNESTFATHYLWEFDDGVTSTEINPVYQYPHPNCDVITLKAFNECYQGAIEKNVNGSDLCKP